MGIMFYISDRPPAALWYKLVQSCNIQGGSLVSPDQPHLL